MSRRLGPFLFAGILGTGCFIEILPGADSNTFQEWYLVSISSNQRLTMLHSAWLYFVRALAVKSTGMTRRDKPIKQDFSSETSQQSSKHSETK